MKTATLDRVYLDGDNILIRWIKPDGAGIHRTALSVNDDLDNQLNQVNLHMSRGVIDNYGKVCVCMLSDKDNAAIRDKVRALKEDRKKANGS